MRNLAFSLVAGAALIFSLAACTGNTPPATTTVVAPPAAPVATAPVTPAVAARAYTSILLQGSLVGQTSSDGTKVTTADCTDKQVDTTGVGTYDCKITYSDGVTLNKVITIEADGSFTSD